MKILRYRHRFANGASSWEYTDDYGLDINHLRENEESQYDWSELYRGMDIEIVDASKEYIEDQIKDCENTIALLKERMEMYRKELNDESKI